jgi:predicted Zn-dependent protease
MAVRYGGDWGIALKQKTSLLGRIAGSAKLTESESKLFDQMCHYSNVNEWEKIRSEFPKLSESLKKTKFCLMLRHVAAQQLNDFDELQRCIEDLRANVKNDPSIEFLSLDYYNRRKEFAKSLATLDAIDKSVGGDPYLDVQRALIHHRMGELKEARRFASRAANREPTLAPAHFLVATLAQSEKDFQAVATALRAAEKIMAVDPEMIEARPVFAEFVASPEFKAWKAESQARSEAKK